MKVSLKAVFWCAVWVVLLTACGKAAFEKAEDDFCAALAKDLPQMSPGTVKDAAILAQLSCVAEEVAEKHADAGK